MTDPQRLTPEAEIDYVKNTLEKEFSEFSSIRVFLEKSEIHYQAFSITVVNRYKDLSLCFYGDMYPGLGWVIYYGDLRVPDLRMDPVILGLTYKAFVGVDAHKDVVQCLVDRIRELQMKEDRLNRRR